MGRNLAAAAITNAACNVIGNDETAVRAMLADLEEGRLACAGSQVLLDALDEARKILTYHAELKLDKGKPS